MNLSLDLNKLGLSDREAAVYLGLLQLGPSAVLPLARKAKVARATTYIILDMLIERGLVMKRKEGKKTLYIPEPPFRLVQLMQQYEEHSRQQRQILNNLLPQLEALLKDTPEQTIVRRYNGLEGIQAIWNEMVMYSKRGDIWYGIEPLSQLQQILGKQYVAFAKQQKAKGIRAFFLSTYPDESPALAIDTAHSLVKRKYIPFKTYSGEAGMIIYRDRIALFILRDSVSGLVVESGPLAAMVSQMVAMLWQLYISDEKE